MFRPQVSPLFRRNEDKAARKAAAKDEIERLRALNVNDLAVDLMPALGPDGPTQGASVREQQVCEYLLRDHPGAGFTETLRLLAPVSRALERLRAAGLVYPISISRSPRWQITPQGKSTLADGSVRERLQGGS
jgi:hypothetical protein